MHFLSIISTVTLFLSLSTSTSSSSTDDGVDSPAPITADTIVPPWERQKRASKITLAVLTDDSLDLDYTVEQHGKDISLPLRPFFVTTSFPASSSSSASNKDRKTITGHPCQKFTYNGVDYPKGSCSKVDEEEEWCETASDEGWGYCSLDSLRSDNNNNNDNEDVNAVPLGYQLSSGPCSPFPTSLSQTIPQPQPQPQPTDVLTKVNQTPIGPSDILDTIFQPLDKLYTIDPVTNEVKSLGAFVYPVLSDCDFRNLQQRNKVDDGVMNTDSIAALIQNNGDSNSDALDDFCDEVYLTKGFIKIEYIHTPSTLTFRPVNERRLQLSLASELKKAEAQAVEMNLLREEIQRLKVIEDLRLKDVEDLRIKKEEVRIEKEEQERLKNIENEELRIIHEANEKVRLEALTVQQKQETVELKLLKEQHDKITQEKADEAKRLADDQINLKLQADKALADEMVLAEEYEAKNIFTSAPTNQEKEKMRFGRLRTFGLEFEYTIKYSDDKKAMGCSFPAGDTAGGVPVTAISQGSEAQAAGVMVGDVLIGVCGDDTSKLSTKKVVKLIMKCKFPRLLKYKVPLAAPVSEIMELSAEASAGLSSVPAGSDMVLHITSPIGFTGSFTIPSSSWGMPIMSCTPPSKPKNIILASGGDDKGCDFDFKVTPKTSFSDDDIIIAQRGICSFVDKARAAVHGGGSAIVIINDVNSPISEMPKGSINTNEIDIPVLSLGSSMGGVLTDALVFGVTAVEGYVGCRGHSNPFLLQTSSMSERNEGDDDEAIGKLYVTSTRTTKTKGYTFTYALFGPQLTNTPGRDTPFTTNIPQQLVPAQPPHGCDASKYESLIRGMVVVVLRGGGCGFGDKVLVAQKLGAVGIVIADGVSTSGGGEEEEGEVEKMPTRAMASPDQAEAVKIPIVSTTHNLWKDVFGFRPGGGGEKGGVKTWGSFRAD